MATEHDRPPTALARRIGHRSHPGDRADRRFLAGLEAALLVDADEIARLVRHQQDRFTRCRGRPGAQRSGHGVPVPVQILGEEAVAGRGSVEIDDRQSVQADERRRMRGVARHGVIAEIIGPAISAALAVFVVAAAEHPRRLGDQRPRRLEELGAPARLAIAIRPWRAFRARRQAGRLAIVIVAEMQDQRRAACRPWMRRRRRTATCCDRCSPGRSRR